uniref:Uncharacterized protein n=1 Tax=Megaselia scalaris TaxID=36166 RepID=T1GM69_MEGSC
MIAARSKALKRLQKNKDIHESVFLQNLMAYCSKDANSCVEKAAKICLVGLRKIEVDSKGRMLLSELRNAIIQDLKSGLTPFFVLATRRKKFSRQENVSLQTRMDIERKLDIEGHWKLFADVICSD